MFEKKVQKSFLEQVSGKRAIASPSSNPIQIYKDMVHYRFIEVIKSAYPIFSSKISNKLLDELVFSFIQSQPRTPYIWQMPSEFRKFIIKNNLLNTMPYVNDLLLYEWIEIELFMKEYTNQKECKFDWDKQIALNESARILEFNYRVYKEKFKKRGRYHLLVYYDFDDHEVHFQEITKFMYLFLKALKKKGIFSALLSVSKKFNVDSAEVKEVLNDTLRLFCSKKILKDR